MKVTLYLPDEIADRLGPFRKDLNLSRILQEALDRELVKVEAARADASGLEGADLERLQKEKAEFEQYWEDVGMKRGMEWALKAGYEDLQHVHEEAVTRPDDESMVTRLERSMWIDWYTLAGGEIRSYSFEAEEAAARGFARGVSLVKGRIG